mmetsp:Transcript_16500/g.25679  ORF Transcript_16500/g.25679 Transcript_16500/m.25679 type:complete len:131 (-) Transcript_16500:264-656(-)
MLIDRGFDISAKDTTGSNALHYACISGNIEIVNLFIAIDPNIDFNVEANNKCAPFHLACLSGNVELVKLLLSRDVDITKTKNGKTALHYACESENVEVVKLLLARDDIDAGACDDESHYITLVNVDVLKL